MATRGVLAGKSGPTIMNQPYPIVKAEAIDPAAGSEMEWVMNFILGIRSIRGK